MKQTRRNWLKHTAASGALLLPGMEAQSAAVPFHAETTLFAFDDHSIPWQHNLKLKLEQVKKHPANPVLRRGAEGSPDHGHALIYGTVLYDGRKFRMWYLGMFQRVIEKGQAPGWWRPMCYAESADGVTWTKPDLGLVEFNGNKRNNICLIEGEPFSLTRVNDFLSILYEPHDPDPARRYKAAYIAHMPYDQIHGGMSKVGRKEQRVASTICATSADGLSWKVVGDRPANAGAERFEASSLYRFGDFYYTTGQIIAPWLERPGGGEIGRVMMAYRSPDFVHWNASRAFSFARPGQLTSTPVPGQQTHMGAGLWNRGNVLVGLYGMWQDGPKEKPAGATRLWGTHIDLGLIVSNDGIHFREPVPDFKVIARGGEGEWDNIALLQAHAFVNKGDETMIWYSHWDTGEGFHGMEIGLATLRRDGFGYLSRMSPESDAFFITRTLAATAKPLEIYLNADQVTPEAPLTVDLLDHLDQPIPGFTAKVTAAGTRQRVNFPKAAKLAPGKKFAIRVHLPETSQVKVYALYAG